MNYKTLLEFLPSDELAVFSDECKRNNYQPIWTYWQEFVTDYQTLGRSSITVRSVRDSLRVLVRHAGVVGLEQMHCIRDVKKSLYQMRDKRQLSEVTFNTYIKNIGSYFRWLHRMDYIAENVLQKMSKATERSKEQYTYSKDRVDAIYAHICTRRQTKLQRVRNRLFIDILRFTGARLTEVLNIRCIDIKPKGGQLVLIIHGIKQKTRLRYYSLPSFVTHSYEEYMAYRKKLNRDDEFLFISSSKHKPWTIAGVRCLFKRLSKELGFRVIAHAFRRFVATELYNRGVDTNHIQHHLGHTRLHTTQHYVKHTCALTAKSGEMMDSVLSSS